MHTINYILMDFFSLYVPLIHFSYLYVFRSIEQIFG